jgi:hypothetical protein
MRPLPAGDIEQTAAQFRGHGNERRLARAPIVEHGPARLELRRERPRRE